MYYVKGELFMIYRGKRIIRTCWYLGRCFLNVNGGVVVRVGRSVGLKL